MMLPWQHQSPQAKDAIDADCFTYKSLLEAITCKLVTFFGVERGLGQNSHLGEVVRLSEKISP